jgi:uncharacterized glyoxalase superfamily protein PhnB
MKTNELSICFCTGEIVGCCSFYEQHFGAKRVFDCGWYVSLRLGGDGPTLHFMEPRDGMPEFKGGGVMLNLKVDDVDAEYDRLVGVGLQTMIPLEDHPWGDRGFSVPDPIGNVVYIYSDREPSEEFRRYHLG